MPCTDPGRPRPGAPSAVRLAILLLPALLASGCSRAPESAAPASAPAAASGAATAAASGAPERPTRAPPQAPVARSPLDAARLWDDYRRQAARRIVERNPDGSYGGPVPEPLLAIPVLQIELNADGSVRRIDVLREPSQALDTVPLAIDAVRRAAPFGDVSHLPRPWKFTETFLFDHQRRFKPRSLDS